MRDQGNRTGRWGERGSRGKSRFGRSDFLLRFAGSPMLPTVL